MEEKRIMHYSSHHKILLVGEGDFSFALCLAKAFDSAVNMVATSLDSKDSLRMKYSRALENLNELEYLGSIILHEVDVHTMTLHPSLQHKLFDRIVFNFPHAGFFCREHDSIQIKMHQEVVRGFMKSGREMVREGGEMHVTHKTAHPFCNWEIEKIAEEEGLYLKKQVPFEISDYEGYCNKRGDGGRCDQSFPLGLCSTFIFTKH